MYIDVYSCPQRRKLCFVSLVWRCYWLVPASYWLVMACSGSACSLFQATTSQNVLTCKFTIYQLHVRSHYNVGQVLQRGSIITKQSSTVVSDLYIFFLLTYNFGQKVFRTYCKTPELQYSKVIFQTQTQPPVISKSRLLGYYFCASYFSYIDQQLTADFKTADLKIC